MPFHFQLQAVLDLRRRERDLEEQLTAKARARHSVAVSQRRQLDADRSAVMHEMRSLGDAGAWMAEQVVHRRRYVDQLRSEISTAEKAIAEIQANLEECRAGLTAANRAVETLEKLRERQLAEYQRREVTAATHEFCDQMSRQYVSAVVR